MSTDEHGGAQLLEPLPLGDDEELAALFEPEDVVYDARTGQRLRVLRITGDEITVHSEREYTPPGAHIKYFRDGTTTATGGRALWDYLIDESDPERARVNRRAAAGDIVVEHRCLLATSETLPESVRLDGSWCWSRRTSFHRASDPATRRTPLKLTGKAVSDGGMALDQALLLGAGQATRHGGASMAPQLGPISPVAHNLLRHPHATLDQAAAIGWAGSGWTTRSVRDATETHGHRAAVNDLVHGLQRALQTSQMVAALTDERRTAVGNYVAGNARAGETERPPRPLFEAASPAIFPDPRVDRRALDRITLAVQAIKPSAEDFAAFVDAVVAAVVEVRLAHPFIAPALACD